MGSLLAIKKTFSIFSLCVLKIEEKQKKLFLELSSTGQRFQTADAKNTTTTTTTKWNPDNKGVPSDGCLMERVLLFVRYNYFIGIQGKFTSFWRTKQHIRFVVVAVVFILITHNSARLWSNFPGFSHLAETTKCENSLRSKITHKVVHIKHSHSHTVIFGGSFQRSV
jgi:hypothetical protein